MNYEKVFETMVSETQSYLEKNNLKTMVLGISGGLDSTVTAAICYEVHRRNRDINFIGVSLPCSSNSDEENNSAQQCMKAFCNEWWTENLQKEYMLMKATCELHTESTNISQGNIKARLRMIYLYNLASSRRGLVMDTDNLTEHYTGFFTIHGDVADYNPIGGLWKHEVYELAKYIRDKYRKTSDSIVCHDPFEWADVDEDKEYWNIKVAALSSAIKITPTDGNGVQDGGDLAQIMPGYTYNDVDKVLNFVVFEHNGNPSINEVNNFLNSNSNITKEAFDKVFYRYKNSEFKRHRMPLVIPREKYEIL